MDAHMLGDHGKVFGSSGLAHRTQVQRPINLVSRYDKSCVTIRTWGQTRITSGSKITGFAKAGIQAWGVLAAAATAKRRAQVLLTRSVPARTA